MLEYTIFLRHGSAKPYTLGTYKSIEGAKAKLYDIINLEIERKRPFFVDNDFFENKYINKKIQLGGAGLFGMGVPVAQESFSFLFFYSSI